MADLNGFDAREVEPAKSFEAVPPGDYLAMVINSEMKTTKAGTGSFIELTLEILEGKHKGRKVWDRPNWTNPNRLCVDIGRSQFSQLCHAVNVLSPKDSCELHDIPCVISVKTKPYDSGLSNEIKEYKPRVHTQPVAQSPGDQSAPWKSN